MSGRIWVDADACPVPVREMILRACQRTQCPVTFVANHPLPLPQRSWVSFQQVPAGFDVADGVIAHQVSTNDLVVTQDIPLAAIVVEKGALSVSPRGERYDAQSVRQRLSMRNFMEELRNSGVQTGGKATFSERDRRQFAQVLDSWLQRRNSAH
ncbi:hypothetical protein SAMN05443662_1069 [Sulfurivirga caldicuralii]|uniref:UPF0178 protein SAMN05443662_1069 n=1 Tax=Sulfurivirga caldicuralii TaxID=364032 RepID=A0A1N6FGF7_9GAMM|nr:YaiI/YqxD family protein [Sulfurivirga caldicuralii]SIN94335.1 hypothetical protein SAMN05443662_1069 [Sulfurivirga caldicuralii]